MLPKPEFAPESLADARIVLDSASAVLRAGTMMEKGSTMTFPRWVPPRTERTLRPDENPGTVQRPPGLEKAASSRRSGQPLSVAMPVKYCEAAIRSETSG